MFQEACAWILCGVSCEVEQKGAKLWACPTQLQVWPALALPALPQIVEAVVLLPSKQSSRVHCRFSLWSQPWLSVRVHVCLYAWFCPAYHSHECSCFQQLMNALFTKVVVSNDGCLP
ncbi:hypothetical protein DUNSADRAFT_14973 [Dunaliella salina]|uniref:Secreted protein n=1 Tax=Dunaliella salina TaxID=3046 RepID=A0ABQ7H259_DUNSA|nr:hypothetical protein DUNSADRAFT_14973 [Dunaliella salina]|eukprot:KAF5840949.1 hypothetical protein DUNSADRAFT_14973 [Dunaliella salina]